MCVSHGGLTEREIQHGVGDRESEMSGLRTEISALRARVAEMEQERAFDKAALDSFTGSSAMADDQITELAMRASQLRDEKSTLEARVAELERRNAELVDQIDQCMSGDGACRASALTTAELQAARLRAEGGEAMNLQETLAAQPGVAP